MLKYFFLLVFSLIIVFIPNLVSAHEAYVLTPKEFSQGSNYTGLNEFTSLQKPENLELFLTVSLAVLLVVIVNFLFRHSIYGKKFNLDLNRFERFAPIPLRIALAISFFYSAYNSSFLGPEIPISSIPFSLLVQVTFYLTSFLFLFGFLTQVAALLALTVFLLGLVTHGSYLLTYFNYFGEIIALLFFGSKIFSLDQLIHNKLPTLNYLQKYESVIIRVSYGIALSFAAISVKFFHPMLTEIVIKRYNLTQFHYLFPPDPHLAVLGAGLAELAIGLFIILGFQTRLVILISLFYITLSLLFFKEAMWPHLILYGISFSLLLNSGESLNLDTFFDNWNLFNRLFGKVR